jgi:HNH endonuclease
MPPQSDFWRNIPNDFRTWLKTFTNRAEFNLTSITERADLAVLFERVKREHDREERESARSKLEAAQEERESARSKPEAAQQERKSARPKLQHAREERESAMQTMLQLFLVSRVNPYAAAIRSASHDSCKDDDDDSQLATRNDSVRYYGLPDENFCQVSGATVNNSSRNDNNNNVSCVINAHIWPRHAAADLFIFDLKPDHIHSPQNVLRLQREIKRAFDNRRLTFVTTYHDDKNDNDNNFVVNDNDNNFVVKVLDPSAIHEPLNDGTNKTLRDIDGKFLQLPNGNLPFTRLLANHSVFAHKKAREMGWIGQDLSEVEIRAEALMFHSLDRDASFRLETL